jgi:hypothetical protein
MLNYSLLNPEEQKSEEEKVESATTRFTENVRGIYTQAISYFYPPDLLNPQEQKLEEEKVESATTRFTENIRSIYSQAISFFYPPDSPEVLKLEWLLTQNRRQQNWYARQIILLEPQLTLLKEYLKNLDEGAVFSLVHIRILKKNIDSYFKIMEDLLKNLDTFTDERITSMNDTLRYLEAYYQDINVNPAENSLRYFREKLADHLSVTITTENKYPPQDIEMILNYIFCADMYEKKYVRYSLSDETILAGLEAFKKELRSKNFSTSPYELKFQTTGIHRQLKEKIQAKITENQTELSECRIKYEFHAAEVRKITDDIDDLKFAEEQEASNLPNPSSAQPDGYQALNGGM